MTTKVQDQNATQSKKHITAQSKHTTSSTESHPQRRREDDQQHGGTYYVKRKEKVVRAEYRKHQQDPTSTIKLRSFQRKNVREPSNREFSGKLERIHETRTLIKKVWDKFRKINKNYKSRIIPPLERGRNIVTLPNEIADICADHYANTSKKPYKKNKPQKTERRRATI